MIWTLRNVPASPDGWVMIVLWQNVTSIVVNMEYVNVVNVLVILVGKAIDVNDWPVIADVWNMAHVPMELVFVLKAGWASIVPSMDVHNRALIMDRVVKVRKTYQHIFMFMFIKILGANCCLIFWMRIIY